MVKILGFGAGFAIVAVAGMWWGWVALAAFAILMGLTWLAAAILAPRFFPRVAEMEVAVVYNTEGQRFARFLGPGRHFVAFPFERIQDRISTGPRVESNVCVARAAGGVPVKIEWKLTYKLDPLGVDPDRQANMARTLARSPGGLVNTHAPNCIQHVFERYTPFHLCGSRMQAHLENTVQKDVVERLRPFGIVVYRVLFFKITWPANVQRSIEAAYERRLQAQVEAETLAIRQKAVHPLTHTDMNRVIGLEQLRVLEHKRGDAVVYMDGSGALHEPESDRQAVETSWAYAVGVDQVQYSE